MCELKTNKKTIAAFLKSGGKKRVIDANVIKKKGSDLQETELGVSFGKIPSLQTLLINTMANKVFFSKASKFIFNKKANKEEKENVINLIRQYNTINNCVGYGLKFDNIYTNDNNTQQTQNNDNTQQLQTK